jgi:hypothetical protein
MSVEAWVGLAITLIGILSTLLIWLLRVVIRIERFLWKVEALEVSDARQWQHIDKHCEELESLGHRVTRIEGRPGHA